MGLLDGKVAIITGAGNGLGEAYAKLFAKEGAAVVVNDLGGPRDGSGSDTSAAQKVVDAITAAGGKAVADRQRRGPAVDEGEAAPPHLAQQARHGGGELRQNGLNGTLRVVSLRWPAWWHRPRTP